MRETSDGAHRKAPSDPRYTLMKVTTPVDVTGLRRRVGEEEEEEGQGRGVRQEEGEGIEKKGEVEVMGYRRGR